MTPAPRASRKSRGESGHLMAGVMAAVAILMIFSTVTFQAWEDVQRRDDEAEMIFRAQEIVRGIVRYRKDRRVSPEKLEDLMEPGSKAQYFLRRLYDDPLVPDGKWGLLFEGPGGQIIDPSETGGIPGVEGPGGSSGSLGLGADESKPGRGPGRGPGNASSQAQAGGQTGMRIAGVKSLCQDPPFRVYKGFADYKDWLFTYLDLEQQQVPGQPGGTPPPGTPPVGTPPSGRPPGGTPPGTPPRPSSRR